MVNIKFCCKIVPVTTNLTLDFDIQTRLMCNLCAHSLRWAKTFWTRITRKKNGFSKVFPPKDPRNPCHPCTRITVTPREPLNCFYIIADAKREVSLHLNVVGFLSATLRQCSLIFLACPFWLVCDWADEKRFKCASEIGPVFVLSTLFIQVLKRHKCPIFWLCRAFGPLVRVFFRDKSSIVLQTPSCPFEALFHRPPQ